MYAVLWFHYVQWPVFTRETQLAAMLEMSTLPSSHQEPCFPPFPLLSVSSGHKWALMLKACLLSVTAYYVNKATAYCDMKYWVEHGDCIFWDLPKFLFVVL